MLHKSFHNAQEAFEELYDYIIEHGTAQNNTLMISDAAFYIEDPLNNHINTPWRNWKPSYAELEWQWYMSGNPNAEEISQTASIWKSMMDENGNVNSNYGYQWQRNNQLERVIDMLIADPTTRRASISLYDGKEMHLYEKDTICTYAINFHVSDETLNMQVLMRSNDLVYGFCNDQYCFSKLHEYVANETGYNVGTYFHYAANMHIYERHFDLKKKNS
jgi:thymidylate synthase